MTQRKGIETAHVPIHRKGFSKAGRPSGVIPQGLELTDTSTQHPLLSCGQARPYIGFRVPTALKIGPDILVARVVWKK